MSKGFQSLVFVALFAAYSYGLLVNETSNGNVTFDETSFAGNWSYAHLNATTLNMLSNSSNSSASNSVTVSSAKTMASTAAPIAVSALTKVVPKLPINSTQVQNSSEWRKTNVTVRTTPQILKNMTSYSKFSSTLRYTDAQNTTAVKASSQTAAKSSLVTVLAGVSSTAARTLTTSQSTWRNESYALVGRDVQPSPPPGLTRNEALICFAVAGCVLLVVCSYFLVSNVSRRYRRWQLNRLLLSIRGDAEIDVPDVDDSPDDAVFIRDSMINRPLNSTASTLGQNRHRDDRITGSNTNSNVFAGGSQRSGHGTASFSRTRTSLFDRMRLRGSHDDADCDLLITDRYGDAYDSSETVSLVATQSRSAASVHVTVTNDRIFDADEPILVLDDSSTEPAVFLPRNDSLI